MFVTGSINAVTVRIIWPFTWAIGQKGLELRGKNWRTERGVFRQAEARVPGQFGAGKEWCEVELLDRTGFIPAGDALNILDNPALGWIRENCEGKTWIAAFAEPKPNTSDFRLRVIVFFESDVEGVAFKLATS